MGGATASVLQTMSEKNGVSDDCTTFISHFLPFCPFKQGKKLRKAAWRVIDVNGNGYVSLAETGKWIMEFLEIQMVGEAGAGDKGKGGKTDKSHPGKAAVKDAQEKWQSWWHQNCNQGRLRSETRIPLFMLLSLHLCSYVRCLQRRRWWWRRDNQRRRPSHLAR